MRTAYFNFKQRMTPNRFGDLATVKAIDLYSGGTRFEYRLGHRLSCMK
jgi:hypothetical protein